MSRNFWFGKHREIQIQFDIWCWYFGFDWSSDYHKVISIGPFAILWYKD